MDDHSGETARGGRRLALFVVLSIAAASGVGWSVIGIVNALESERCGPYGYGGYCAPFEITVTPTTDLVDGQPVTVKGRRFTPNTSFGAAVCAPAVPGIDGCDLSNTALTTTDSKGQATVTLRVRRMINVRGHKIDCALKPCVLGAGTVNGITPIEVTSVPITFDPDVPPLPPLQVRVTLSSATTRGMTGTVTCSRAASADVSGFIHQPSGSFAEGYTMASVDCGTTASTWTFRYQSHQGTIIPGATRYDVFASATDGLDYASASIAGSVKLTNPPVAPTRSV